MKVLQLYNIMNQIFFVDFGENRRLKDFNLAIIYNRPTFAFCLLIVIQLLFYFYSALTGKGDTLFNDPRYVIQNGQYYRLLTAPFSTNGSAIDFFWLITTFWWMLSIFPLHQHKYSSIHLLIEIFIQNLILQIIFCIAFFFLEGTADSNINGNSGSKERYINTGWDSLVVIWVFMFTSFNKRGKSYLFFLPIEINNQYLAWTMSISTLFMAKQRLPIIIGMILGSIQYHILNRSFIKLPVQFYEWAQNPLTTISKYFPSFIPLQSTNQSLVSLIKQQKQDAAVYEIKIHEDENHDLLNFQPTSITQNVNEHKIIQQIDQWVQEERTDFEKSIVQQYH